MTRRNPVLLDSDVWVDFDDNDVDAIRNAQGNGDDSDSGVGMEDDFDAFVRARFAARNAGGRPQDDLAAEAHFNRIQHAEEKAAAPYVRTVPPTVTSAVWGNQQECVSGDEPKIVCFWTGADVEATPILVSLVNIRTIVDGQAQVNASYRPYALIKYGTKGVFAEAKVDIAQNRQLVVLGSAVYVYVAMDPAPVGQNPGKMQLGASLAFGAARSGGPVIRTLYFDNVLAASSSRPVSIPYAAVQLLPVQKANVADDIVIEFRDSNPGVSGGSVLYTYSLPPGQIMTSPVPITGDVASVVISNLGPLSASVRLPFELSL